MLKFLNVGSSFSKFLTFVEMLSLLKLKLAYYVVGYRNVIFDLLCGEFGEVVLLIEFVEQLPE